MYLHNDENITDSTHAKMKEKEQFYNFVVI